VSFASSDVTRQCTCVAETRRSKKGNQLENGVAEPESATSQTVDFGF